MAGTKDIKEFTKYPSLSDNDYLLGTKTDLGGTDAGITVADFKKLVAQDVKPTIKNGYWWVNGVNTGELATGRTPQFRYTVNGMEMKYDNEDDTAFRVIIPIEDLLFTFDDLTPEQVELLKLKFSDLTEAEKNELRGKAFTYADFTSEQLADLRLTWDKLTPTQKKELQGERGYSAFEVWEQQEENTGKTVDDYLSWLRLPAVSAALAIREEMDQIAEEAEEVIRETNAAGEEADKAAVRANNAAEAAEGIVAGIVPTKTSDLENDSGFITKVVDDLANYLLKSETYTREEVLNLISQIKGVSILPVEVLPDTGETNIIYFLPKEGAEDDVYDEYIWISGKWERIGSTSIDLSKYYTKEDADNRYVLKMLGKRLMTDEEGEKLAGIEGGANKFEYPADPATGHVITWGANGAIWAQPSSGGEYIELGDILQIDRVKATTALDWNDFIKGCTMDDMERAYTQNVPVYSMIQNRYFQGKIGYSKCTSIMKRVDGTVVHYYLAFVVAYGATNSNNIYNYLIDLRGVTGEGWRDATSRAACSYTKTTVAVGTSVAFTGGFIVMDLSTSGSRDLLINPSGFYPLHNSTTTVMLRNTSTLTTKLAFTIKLGADTKLDGSVLLIPSDLPELAGGEACELNILWADWKYIVRASESFNYKEYVE